MRRASRAIGLAITFGGLAALPAAGAPCMPRFDAQPVFDVGENFGMSALGDFDGDGDLDLTTGVYLFFNDGHGAFEVPGICIAAQHKLGAVFDAGVTDFDGDGFLDLALSMMVPDKIWFLHGREQPGEGETFFADEVQIPCVPISWHMVLSDFDEDGRPDVFAVSGVATLATLVLNRGERQYEPVIFEDFPSEGHPVATGDFDGDGHADVIFCSGHRVTILYGQGDGTFRTPVASTLLVAGHPWDAHRFRAADLDGDGRADLVAAGGEEVIIYWGSSIDPATGLPLSPAMTLPLAGTARFVEIADMNADGVLDIVGLSAASQGVARVRIFAGERGESGPEFTAGENILVSAAGVGALFAVGDLDGDGTLDIVITGEDTGRGEVLLNGGSCAGEAARGDANADGILDLADPIGALGYIVVGDAVPCPGAAEVNGDGRLDLADPVYLLWHLFASGPAPVGESPVDCR
ncbi:MAG: VCBS repeat-containing protein [Planctomycetes bacterium]|nr:VCBS repeat-containing protein [Planctomycetota bacterium]